MVRQRDLAVVVDSGSCLPAGLLREWAISVVPHRLILEGYSYRDGVDIHPTEFYRTLRTGRCTPTTSGPTPSDFLDVFSVAVEAHKDVLCLTPAAGFSVTYQSALAASRMNGDAPEHARIEVIDTGTAGGGTGLLALAAARWASQGLSIQQVTLRVRSLIPRVNLAAFLDSLQYLQRGGRLGKIPALAGGLLNIKPLVKMQMGEARLLAKPRGRVQATTRLLEFLRESAGTNPLWVNIMEADAASEAGELLPRIKSEFDCRLAITSQFTPVMGAHTGPGVLGIAFYTGDGECPT